MGLSRGAEVCRDEQKHCTAAGPPAQHRAPQAVLLGASQHQQHRLATHTLGAGLSAAPRAPGSTRGSDPSPQPLDTVPRCAALPGCKRAARGPQTPGCDRATSHAPSWAIPDPQPPVRGEGAGFSCRYVSEGAGLARAALLWGVECGNVGEVILGSVSTGAMAPAGLGSPLCQPRRQRPLPILGGYCGSQQWE